MEFVDSVTVGSRFLSDQPRLTVSVSARRRRRRRRQQQRARRGSVFISSKTKTNIQDQKRQLITWANYVLKAHFYTPAS